MPEYEVEYSHFVPEYGVMRVTANNMDEVEDIALEQLADSDQFEGKGIAVETIREIKY